MTEQTGQPSASGDEFRCAYTVGLTKEGKLAFRPHGDSVGVVELMGLHAYATHRLKLVLDINQQTGDAISIEILRTLREVTSPQPEELPPVAAE